METRVPTGVGVARAQTDSKYTPLPPPRIKDLATGSRMHAGEHREGAGEGEKSFWFLVLAELVKSVKSVERQRSPPLFEIDNASFFSLSQALMKSWVQFATLATVAAHSPHDVIQGIATTHDGQVRHLDHTSLEPSSPHP